MARPLPVSTPLAYLPDLQVASSVVLLPCVAEALPVRRRVRGEQLVHLPHSSEDEERRRGG